MTHFTTMTSKGQITIPKKMREALNLSKNKKIGIDLASTGKEIKIRAYPNIIELAGTFKPKKKIDVMKAREAFEKGYERI